MDNAPTTDGQRALADDRAAPAPTHRPWCWPDCAARNQSPEWSMYAHERVLSIAHLNYGPTVAIGLGNELKAGSEEDDITLHVHAEDGRREQLALAPEEARMLARYLVEAAEQWESHRAAVVEVTGRG